MKNNIKMFCLISVCTFLYKIEARDVEVLDSNLALEYLYPQYYFYQVEHIGKQLHSDLDLVHEHYVANGKESIDMEYILKQAETLCTMVGYLKEHESKSYHYLRDDIEYLLTIVDQIEGRLLKSLPQAYTKKLDAFVKLCRHVYAAKKQLEIMLSDSLEVVI